MSDLSQDGVSDESDARDELSDDNASEGSFDEDSESNPYDDSDRKSSPRYARGGYTTSYTNQERGEGPYLPRELIPKVLGRVEGPANALEAYGSVFGFALADANRKCKAKRERDADRQGDDDPLSSCLLLPKVAGKNCALACRARSQLGDRKEYVMRCLLSVLDHYLYPIKNGGPLIKTPIVEIDGITAPFSDGASVLVIAPIIHMYVDGGLEARLSYEEHGVKLSYMDRYGDDVEEYLRIKRTRDIALRVMEVSGANDPGQWLDFAVRGELRLSLPLLSLGDSEPQKLLGLLTQYVQPLMVSLIDGQKFPFTPDAPDINYGYGKATFSLSVPGTKGGNRVEIRQHPWLTEEEKSAYNMASLERAATDLGYSLEDSVVRTSSQGFVWLPMIRELSPAYQTV